MNDLTIILIFASKLPVYIYVAHRAYIFRHSLLLISANWLGTLAFMGTISSLSVVYLDRTVAGAIAYGVVLSLFMLGYTAKELKAKE